MLLALLILIILLIFTFGASCGMLHKKKEQVLDQTQLLEKLLLYYQLLNMWLEMKQKEKSVVTYLKQKGINRIAIYGMKELGERFYEALR